MYSPHCHWIKRVILTPKTFSQLSAKWQKCRRNWRQVNGDVSSLDLKFEET